MFINRGGEIIAGDGTVWEGVKEFRATRLEGRVQRVFVTGKHKGLAVQLVYGLISQPGGIMIGIYRKRSKK